MAKAIEHNLLVIPGNIFSRRDTHFRISYAVDDAVIHRGIETLNKLAQLLDKKRSRGSNLPLSTSRSYRGKRTAPAYKSSAGRSPSTVNRSRI